MSLDELIARLEAAEDYDPLLNVAIWRAVDPDAVDRMDRELSQFGVDDYLLANNCEDFTGSLDAAMGLVPEGWGVGLDIIGGGAVACLTLPGNSFLGDRGDTDLYGRSKSAPLALCIAALRARVQP